ncbi:rod shape-determining protein MreC [Candidatus Sumerlaeota bacterium]|nr:rod shape-determining protein MreC [Candidatus Sumerlaeota bacterium]
MGGSSGDLLVFSSFPLRPAVAVFTKTRKPLRATGLAVLAMIVCAIVLQSLDRRDPQQAGLLRRSLNTICMPFLKGGAQVHRGAEAAWIALFRGNHLTAENEELRAEVAQLRATVAAIAAEDQISNRRNEVEENISVLHGDLMSASVLGETPARGRRLLWIGAGMNENVRSGMVAVGPHGIIGAVEEVYGDSATVRLVSDYTSSWGVEIEGKNELGLLKGIGDSQYAELHFGRTIADVQAGQAIISSGMASSVAPGGLPFGVVESVKRNKQGEPVAIVKLGDDATRLRTIFLLPAQQIAALPPVR